ncbi:MAG TPA: hypothetical protein VJZ71_09395 [Phycisphaerae bacterium]|nr:hypothetical protein [Phycisphaerae bacterium]
MLAPSVPAHVISIVHGTALVFPDRIDVELTVNAEDFVHYYGASAAQGDSRSDAAIERAAVRHADHLFEHFIIRDVDGERLSGRVVSFDTIPVEAASTENGSRHSRIVYLLEYSLTAPPRYLSFQQTLGSGDAGLPSQLYLDVRTEDNEESTALRLTSGGNVETLKLHWPNGARSGDRSEIVGPLEELKSIATRVEIDDAGTRVLIDLPVPLLETFLPVRRTGRDFLESSEHLAAQRAIEEFLHGRLPMQINGRHVEPHATSLNFLDLEPDGAANSARRQRRSAWTTRVRVVQSYPTLSMPQAIELQWTLFNPLVLEVQAVIACGHRESIHRLSTYDPILRWTSAASGVVARSLR